MMVFEGPADLPANPVAMVSRELMGNRVLLDHPVPTDLPDQWESSAPRVCKALLDQWDPKETRDLPEVMDQL